VWLHLLAVIMRTSQLTGLNIFGVENPTRVVMSTSGYLL